MLAQNHPDASPLALSLCLAAPVLLLQAAIYTFLTKYGTHYVNKARALMMK